MNPIKPRQLYLPIQNDLYHHLPDPVRCQCQELLSQLLIELIVAELPRRETNDGPEDSINPS